MQDFDPGRMRTYRETAALTQTQAAKKAGMSQSQWSQIEAGTRSDVKLSTLQSIAKAVGCEVQDLLTPPKPKGGRSK